MIFTERTLTDSHIGTIKATHKIRWMGIEFYLHDPSHTIWGCNVLSDYFLEVGVFDAIFNTTVFLGQMIIPDWEGPSGFHFKFIEKYKQHGAA